MVKFLIGLVTGVLLVFLTVGILFFALLRFREKPPEVANNSVLVLRLNGAIPERTPVEIPFLSEGPSLTVSSVWMDLRKAAADPRIKAVVLEPEGVAAGWAKLEEIRGDIDQFRKSGKPVFAYLRTPTAREYYIATAADRIYLGPEDPVYLKGMRAEIMYFKKTLDKLGVNVDVEHAGKYKDFGDMFTRTDMSPETREVINALVDDLYGNLLARIAAGRKMTTDRVRTLIDQGPFLATEAKSAGLIDELRFEDQMWGELKSRVNAGDLKRVKAETYARVPPESVGLAGKSRIALVIGEGDITRGDPDNPAADENGLTSAAFDKLLEQVSNDSSIKAVIVRIDSPGGEVTASDDLWRYMNLLSRKKPMVISMSDVAASGGYYMALTGDPIVAYSGTETGSIGVVFGKPNLHGLYDKLGITKDAVQRGKNADIDSDYTALTPDQQQKLRHGIDVSYQEFVSKVASARHRKFEEIEPVAQGRVWLGSQAKMHGLVDELGGLDKAIELVKKKANIPTAESVSVVMYPPRRSLLDLVVRRSQDDVLTSRLAQALPGLPFHAWIKGGFLRLMPYRIEVR
ncbi:MAG: signal peptide peptidase SppA [Terriglobia bacterium]|nr:MAG: signal peptide peptidase SppA [Terriglobia bacterium]